LDVGVVGGACRVARTTGVRDASSSGGGGGGAGRGGTAFKKKVCGILGEEIRPVILVMLGDGAGGGEGRGVGVQANVGVILV
jgi:hypothetical protein